MQTYFSSSAWWSQSSFIRLEASFISCNFLSWSRCKSFFNRITCRRKHTHIDQEHYCLLENNQNVHSYRNRWIEKETSSTVVRIIRKQKQYIKRGHGSQWKVLGTHKWHYTRWWSGILSRMVLYRSLILMSEIRYQKQIIMVNNLGCKNILIK